MGSFDFTCAVSRMPIAPGDEVRLVLLQSRQGLWGEDGNRGIYPYTWWGPWSFPLRGIYQDYGKFRVDKDQGTWTALLRGQVLKRPLGPNPYHDAPVNRDLSFDDLMWALSEDRVKARVYKCDDKKKYRPISFTAIHKPIWEYMVDRGRKIHSSPTQEEMALIRAQNLDHVRLTWEGLASVFNSSRALELALERAPNPSEDFWADVEGMAHVGKALWQFRMMWLPSTAVGWQSGDLSVSAGMYREFARIAVAIKGARKGDKNR